MKKSKLIIHQPKIRGCDDSFFYENLIAKKGKYELHTVGDIRIYHTDKKGNVIGQHNGFKSYDDFPLEINCDKDLEKVENNFNNEYYWDMNNWFEIFDSSNEIDIGYVCYSYKEALNHLKSL